jgi:type I restriction enzyme, R subunit
MRLEIGGQLWLKALPYRKFRIAGLHDLRVVTIFTPSINEDDEEANGLIGEPDFDLATGNNSHSRDKLAEFINDYNALYQTQHSVKDSKGLLQDTCKNLQDRHQSFA